MDGADASGDCITYGSHYLWVGAIEVPNDTEHVFGKRPLLVTVECWEAAHGLD